MTQKGNFISTGALILFLAWVILMQGQEVAAQAGTAKTSAKKTQTKTAPVQKKTVPVQKKASQTVSSTKTVNKPKDEGTIKIGSQIWAAENLNVVTFLNGDTIPEARSDEEWISAGKSGKPAWCYYNNDPKNGLKYGKLYNWFAVNDSRGLAPAGWSLPSASDWAQLAAFLGGSNAAGSKLKSTSGWADGYIGTNESGFNGLPGGYRVANGKFLNLGTIGTWWTSTESKPGTAVDHYLGQRGSLERSNNPKEAGESVRCIRRQK